MTTRTTEDPRARYSGWVAPLCWTAVALEGFDLVVLGVVLPSLLQEPGWGLTPNTASLVSVVGLVGVMVGAMAVGSDQRRHRPPPDDASGPSSCFSVLTLRLRLRAEPLRSSVCCGSSPGSGSAGCCPRRSRWSTSSPAPAAAAAATTTLMTGYHVGAVAHRAARASCSSRATAGESMFVIGALPALVLVPADAEVPAGVGRRSCAPAPGSTRPAGGAAEARARTRSASCSSTVSARSTIAFWITSFMGLLLVYGLNTWLPQIMRVGRLRAGRGAGAAAGAQRRRGARPAGRRPGGRPDRQPPLHHRLVRRRGAVPRAAEHQAARASACTVSVLLAGMFVFSAQVLVYAYVSHALPGRRPRHRDRRRQRRRPARRDLRPADRRLAAHRRPGLPVGLLHLRRRSPRSAPLSIVAGQPRPGAGRAAAGHRGRGRPRRRAAP